MAAAPIRVGLVGIGNCASSFVQGLHHYRDAAPGEPVPGLMSPDLGGYRVRDIAVVAAFDVAAGKVGRDLAAAILAAPNNTQVFAAVPETGVTVRRGPTHDGIGRYLEGVVAESPEPVADVVAELRRTGTQVLVSYLPVGSQAATEFYADCALQAGCAFVNCIPVFIASNPEWAERFAARGCRSSGTTSRAKSAPPSCTGCWPISCASAASGWTGPTSSTSAATPTS